MLRRWSLRLVQLATICYFVTIHLSTKENKKFVLEFKKSLQITRDKPSVNRIIRSAPLYLFDTVLLSLTPLLGSSILGFFYLDLNWYDIDFHLKSGRHVWMRLNPRLRDWWSRYTKNIIIMSCNAISSD